MNGPTARFRQARAIADGPAALDLLAAGVVSSAQLESPDAPRLLAAMAAGALETHGITVMAEPVAGGILLRPGGSGVPATAPPAPHSGAARPADIERAKALAARTLVPESDASRTAGAGAGLSDND